MGFIVLGSLKVVPPSLDSVFCIISGYIISLQTSASAASSSRLRILNRTIKLLVTSGLISVKMSQSSGFDSCGEGGGGTNMETIEEEPTGWKRSNSSKVIAERHLEKEPTRLTRATSTKAIALRDEFGRLPESQKQLFLDLIQ